VAIPGLVGLNMTLTPEFWWSLFAAGGWGIGLTSHYVYHNNRKQQLVETFQQLEQLQPGTYTASKKTSRNLLQDDDTPHPSRDEAYELCREIEAAVQDNTTFDDTWKKEMGDLINNYFGNFIDLTKRAQHVEKILAKFNVRGLEESRQELLGKQKETSDQGLIDDFDQALEKINEQISSIKSLTTQHDKLELKVKSELLDLKQLQLDLTRLEIVAPDQTQDQLQTLRQKSQELTIFADILDQELSKSSDE